MTEILGIKPALALAGFIGGVISLSFMQKITPIKAFMATLTGAGCAAYLTPLVIEKAELSGSSEHAAAFLIGILGMNILAGIFKISEKFKAAPLETLQQVRGKDDG